DRECVAVEVRDEPIEFLLSSSERAEDGLKVGMEGDPARPLENRSEDNSHWGPHSFGFAQSLVACIEYPALDIAAGTRESRDRFVQHRVGRWRPQNPIVR